MSRDPQPLSEDETSVWPVDRFEGALDATSPFRPEDEPAIAERWRASIAAKPLMFDGTVLLGVDVRIENRVLGVRYAEARFSAFDWWRATGPARGLRNVFGAGVVISSDGAALLGRMAPHTAPAGKIYFPCGTPDLDDVTDGRVDLDGSIEREIAEETGLGRDLIAPSETRLCIVTPKVAAYVRRFDSALPAAELKRVVEAELARQQRPELDQIIFARSAAEVTDASPPYVRLALSHLIGGG